MEILNIPPTPDSPQVIVSSNHVFSIFGNSFMENPVAFFQPIVKLITHIKADFVMLELDLEIINSANKIEIFNIIELAKKNINIRQLKVFWITNPSDEDSFDLGKQFESALEIPFDFLVYN